MEPKLTDEDEAEIAERYQRGATTRQLAVRFDVSHTAIEKALDRAQVDRRPGRGRQLEHVDTDTIVELRQSRHTWAEIATICRLSPSGVRKRYWAAVGVSDPTGDD